MWGGIGRYAVHVTGGRVQAADLAHNTQNDPGLRTLRLVFDTYAFHDGSVNGFHPVEHLQLRRPDGETVGGSGSSEGFAPPSWTVTTENWIQVPVEADVAGDVIGSPASRRTPWGRCTDLIEHTTMAFSLPDVAPGEPPAADVPRPAPLPPADTDDPTATTVPSPIDVDVTGTVMNVGGFTTRRPGSSGTPRRRRPP